MERLHQHYERCCLTAPVVNVRLNGTRHVYLAAIVYFVVRGPPTTRNSLLCPNNIEKKFHYTNIFNTTTVEGDQAWHSMHYLKAEGSEIHHFTRGGDKEYWSNAIQVHS